MIFYFSATGNSLYAAGKLKSSLNEKLVDITDAMRKKEFTYQVGEGEKVGFVFPAYFYGVPLIVDDFVRQLALASNTNPYIFAVMTCGGSVAAADKQFAGLLLKRGYSLSLFFPLPMSNNYMLWYELPSPAAQEADLISADRRLVTIAGEISQGNTGGYSSGVMGALVTAFSYPVYRHGRRTRKFYAEDTCTACGLCEKICPCDAIRMTDGKPAWVAKQCIQCLGCINRCPVAAIQYGKATRKRRRFVNPVLKQKVSGQ